MRFASLVLLSSFILVSTLNVNASCLETYKEAALSKSTKRRKVINFAQDQSNFMAPITAGFLIASAFKPITPFAPIVAGYQGLMYLVSASFSVANSVGSQEQRVLDYEVKAKKLKGFMKRILKNAQRNYPHTTMEDILKIIGQGFESGDFCANNKLFGPRKIRKYVLMNLNK